MPHRSAVAVWVRSFFKNKGNINRIEVFDYNFERFKQDYSDCGNILSDSTYFELMDWYDATYRLGSEEENSNEARDFANYVWDRIHADEQKPEMLVFPARERGYYNLEYMSEGELRSMLTMIKGACLEERRVFDRVKRQIEKMLEK